MYMVDIMDMDMVDIMVDIIINTKPRSRPIRLIEVYLIDSVQFPRQMTMD